MFRPSFIGSSSGPQRKQIQDQIFYKNALWDPKYSKNVIKVVYKL